MLDDIEPTAALEVEQTRLESIVALVYEDRHYSPSCHCASCVETRTHLEPRDLQFVNHVGTMVSKSLAISRQVA
jgi:hypothetical protein